jgi:hypothetical protein
MSTHLHHVGGKYRATLVEIHNKLVAIFSSIIAGRLFQWRLIFLYLTGHLPLAPAAASFTIAYALT